ncbi:glycoside hydrolase family 88 protein [Scleroderma citrinum Foug A]|uniref:Glycoside hydrolase family 88 protein n=1 Tax=Scleroderma citrinum Foug A TaxID=1036808 RepID=A0A0C3D2V9_9AGAM|nr:glycoside hydrolase family 88 protein [Scleroderma citrinum Foug A]
MSYLETSHKMATYLLDSFPLDSVVPWDFDAPLVPMCPADTSAVTIALMGLLLLVQQENSLSPANTTNVARWISGTWKALIPHTDAQSNCV